MKPTLIPLTNRKPNMKNILWLLLLPVSILAQKPLFTTAKTQGATVYFNGAELQHSAQLNLPVGNSEIVIKNVADYINESTLQIKAPKSVTVMSVQFTKNYISEYEIDESNPAIKKVRDSIEIVKKEIKKVQIQIYTHQQTIGLLDNNQQVGDANSGLNTAELMKMVEYYKAKRIELDNQIEVFKEKETKWNKTLANLNARLQLNTAKEEKMSKGKLVVQVLNEVAGTVTLNFSYITNSAGWKPMYDLRANSIKDPIQLLYKAQVWQSTGIDWKKIKMSLSSGNPNQSNEAPLQQAWFLRYREFREGDKNTLYETPLNNFNYYRGNSYTKQEENKYVDSTEVAFGYDSMDDYVQISESQLNVTFDIDIPYDVLSNGKMHSVSLKEIQIPATYKFYSAPRLEKEAYLLAKIDNYGQYNLLPGEANIVFEEMNVGKTFINPEQTGDTLSLSMGRDKKISIKREKVVDKSGTKFLSSYKEQTFTYDITIRNNKKEEINLTLKDQHPLSSDKDITIEVLEDGKASVNPETGFMTWDLKLAPNESKKIRISYKVRYPKDKIIDNL
ncbi:MAG: DUF4139 domain-containing protein [Flavobacterium sp.]|jgi:uncharacterized protein (TIGR02231 family)|uniref:DUF4139 domain-containing protein n=1 Tax=Flavobacterium sp. TaxID=239 RepID=UPI0022C92FD8|nr:DUF4139 domain-containing protein [Flavobacterium sp.]MCZ8169741.1 DUF4139 domain-containing protein [Flavobacterium sp.]MCZ8296025.1 DUF4139 domain-containing protein [Flavobacterium sp.]